MRYAPRCATAARRFPAGVEIVLLPDLAGRSTGRRSLAGMDAVVHLAGIAHVGPEIPDAIYDRVNHLATAALARAAAAAGVRQLRVHVLDRARRRAPRPISRSPRPTPHPTDAYGRSKLAAEDAVRASGLPYTILRPALVYGPDPKGNLARLMRLARCPCRCPSALSATAARCSRSTT